MAALYLLVGQSVERPGQAAHAGAEGQVRVGEGRADQVGGVGGHVTSLVVTGGVIPYIVYSTAHSTLEINFVLMSLIGCGSDNCN